MLWGRELGSWDSLGCRVYEADVAHGVWFWPHGSYGWGVLGSVWPGTRPWWRVVWEACSRSFLVFGAWGGGFRDEFGWVVVRRGLCDSPLDK
jgi:hypothetical protein